jgi:hypothetical protein
LKQVGLEVAPAVGGAGRRVLGGGGGSGGFGSALTWLALVLLGVGYVICGRAGW